MKKALPIGVSDFGDMITGNGYYADKTLMIAEWLQTMNAECYADNQTAAFWQNAKYDHAAGVF